MPTLRQTIQAAPAQASELITKLSNTSNQALKTRETLFQDLQDELSLYVELEEKHLLPLLRKKPETKDLAAEAVKGNKELRAKLEELSASPKDNDAFLEKLAELKKGFQRHVRDERQELLPAVVKALSDEEASEIANKMQDGIADAENAKLEAKRKERDKEREEIERAARREQKKAERAAAEAADQIADAFTIGATSAGEGARQVTTRIAEQVNQATASVTEATAVYRDTVEKTLEGFGKVATSSTTTTKAISEIGSVWMEWLQEVGRTNTEVVGGLMACRDPRQLAETQRDFVTRTMRSGIERNAKVLQIAQRSTSEALAPLVDA